MNNKKFLTTLLKTLLLIATVTSLISKTSITTISTVNAEETSAWQLSLQTELYHIRAFQVYNEELYASGHNINGTNGTLYKYNGVEWVDMHMGEKIEGTLHLIDSLLVFNDRLYIGTSVSDGTLLSRVYYYDGEEFFLDHSAPGTSGNAGIEALAVHNGELYASNGSLAGEVYMRVNDNNWVTVGGSAIETDSPVRALASYNGYLYAGTGVSGDDAKVWKWTGAEWELSVNFKMQHNTTKDGVVSLVVANNQLHAGTSGPGSTAYIFSFDGTNWVKTLEIPNCNSSWLSFANNTVWAGSNQCNADAYQLNNGQWESIGGANVNFVSFGIYNNHIFGGTVGDGKILSLSLISSTPQVVSIERNSTSPTSAVSVDFTVTFSEPVQNVDVSDFILTKSSGISDESITAVSGSGAAYTVRVNTALALAPCGWMSRFLRAFKT